MATSSQLDSASTVNPSLALKVALVGFGTVGSSVARLLCEERHQRFLRLTHVYNRNVARKKVDWVPQDVSWTENIEDVLSSDADIIVELIGGLEPAGSWLRRALESGKSVVTANKKLIAQDGIELAEIAHRAGVTLAYGASVAGGVPVLSGLNEGLAGDHLYKVCGVLNGTCNYILTRIEGFGVSFAQALSEAQKAGFAEADPTDDVDGYDARSKLAILARIALDVQVNPETIDCQSIREIEPVDFSYAHDLDCTVRQIARAEFRDGKFFASVRPALVSRKSPLAQLNGGQNIVMSTGEFGGETAFWGHGAGGHQTAVAVVSDLLAIARGQQFASSHEFSVPRECTVNRDFVSPYYLRFNVKDRPGIVAGLSQALANHGINVVALLQKPGYTKDDLPFVITLEECKTSQVEAALTEIRRFDFLVKQPMCLPILPRSL